MALFMWRGILKRAAARFHFHRPLSVYNSSHGFEEKDIRRKLDQLSGGSVKLHKREDGIAELCISNPARMNAFTGTMMTELAEQIGDLESWEEGKGLVLYGAENTFCSGSDITSVKHISKPQDGMMMSMFMQNTLTRLQRLPLISVALVQGKALGGGAEICTACDFRLMTGKSEIRFIHKHMGLASGWGGATRLIQLVGSRQALKLFGSALSIHPEHALIIGLADEILSCDDDESLEEARRWLSSYTNGPAYVNRAIKKGIVSGREKLIDDSLRTENDIVGTVWSGPANLQALSKRTKYN